MKPLKERIAIEQAFLDGKGLEFIILEKSTWYPYYEPTEMAIFDWESCDYRIKQEPMEFWVNVYENDTINTFTSKAKADTSKAHCYGMPKSIKVREVESD